MDNLNSFLKKEKIAYSQKNYDLEKNSLDASLFKIKPKIIIYPKNKFEISNILKYVSENKNSDNYKGIFIDSNYDDYFCKDF